MKISARLPKPTSAIRVNPQNANTRVEGEAFLDSYVSQIQDAQATGESVDSFQGLRQTSVAVAFEVAHKLLGATRAVELAGQAMLAIADEQDISHLDSGSLQQAGAKGGVAIEGSEAKLYFGNRKKTGFAISTTKSVVLPEEFKGLADQPVGAFLKGHELEHIKNGDVLKQFGQRYLLANLEGTRFHKEANQAKREADHTLELAADRGAVNYMLDLGYSPEVIRKDVHKFLGFIESDPSDSHPGRDTRWANIEASLEQKSDAAPPASAPMAPTAEATLAEKREDSPTIAVFDFFNDDSLHGEIVESLIMEKGFQDAEIQRYDSTIETPVELLNGKSQGFGKRLDTFIGETPARLLDQASANLRDVLEKGTAKVVNMSLGDSKIDTVERIVNRSKFNKSFEATLWKHLGLNSYSSEKAKIQALASKVDQAADSSPRLRQAKEQFEAVVEQAKSEGVHVVLAAGNHGRLASAYENAGLKVKEDFFASHLAVDSALVVGASNSSGEPAPLTPPRAGADLAAPGTMVTTKLNGQVMIRSGTSFAAPQVSRKLAQMHAENPEGSLEEREAALLESLTPAPGEESYLGAGVLKA